MQVPGFDLSRQNAQIGHELQAVISEVITKGRFILGENVVALESEVAAYCGADFGVGVANGSDALHLALLALGIGPGDEVIVPAFTFFATAGAVARAGASPVFADVDPSTFTLDPDSFERCITDKTSAVIPVHLYGHPADMDRIMEIARSRGIKVIEDGAQAIGAEYRGQRVGAIGDIGTLSFFPTKNLGAFGDGGMLLTRDPELANRLQMLRAHGAKVKYHHELMGYNSRLDEVQAAILRVKLQYLDQWTDQRQAIADMYTAKLADVPGVELPAVASHVKHVYHQYTVVAENRVDLQRRCNERGVATTVYYPVPLHQQPVFTSLSVVKLPIAERLSNACLSLPMFPELSEEEMSHVIRVISDQ